MGLDLLVDGKQDNITSKDVIDDLKNGASETDLLLGFPKLRFCQYNGFHYATEDTQKGGMKYFPIHYTSMGYDADRTGDKANDNFMTRKTYDPKTLQANGNFSMLVGFPLKPDSTIDVTQMAEFMADATVPAIPSRAPW